MRAWRRPQPILHMVRGKVVQSCPLAQTPPWAKPILAAAPKASETGRRR